jgi:GH24 family phage-related lysozyme (muramidase)
MQKFISDITLQGSRDWDRRLDALAGYVYNTGRLYETKLLDRLNTGDFLGAARKMDMITPGKVVKLQGLVNR